LLLVFIFFYLVVFSIFQEYNVSVERWMELGILCFCMYLFILFILYILHKKLDEDIDAIVYYLKKIDAKEYNAKLKIKNYLEFLEISLLLKNLVKRVYAKDKKNSKK